MEREFHKWLKTRIETSPWVELGIGDDAAVLKWESGTGVVLATDSIADGTHFDLSQHELSRIGRKAIAVNLSDIAAMGAKPVAALLDFNIPKSFSLIQLKQLFLGCDSICREFEVAIIGGDTNTWNGPLVVGATLVGRKLVVAGRSSVWKMSTAKPDDEIVVSGDFGGSILGHHLDFTPRIKLATYLMENYQINAATDASDSLSLDLAAVATSSGVGVELVFDRIPVSAAAREQASKDGRSAFEHAMTDGEDFELLLAIPGSQWRKLQTDEAVNNDLTSVGRFTAAPGFWILHSDGSRKSFEPTGYTH